MSGLYGFFLTEFETIFKEQFKVTRTYERIVKCLAEKSCAKEVERVLICAGEVTAALQNSDYFHHILGLDAIFG
ncbi:MAG: hypothetical protein U9O82_06540 [Thermodesulfobacteriota bacterium]|nr:hypothetical protein [Thermodesulfobacteriota bacterium]